jgi:hypothetical protein
VRGRQLALIDPDHARFVEWVRANPAVVAAFRAAARSWVAAGHDRCSAKMLVEVVRWQAGLGLVTGDDGFRINNSWTARLGRHVVETTPDLPADLFEMRRLKYDGALAEPEVTS